MTTTAFWYGNGLRHALSDVNVLVDTIKMALCTSTYSPNQNTHQVFSNITNEVIGSTGYTAGGKQLTTVAVSYDAPSKTVSITADAPVWALSTITARIAVIYKDTGNPATSPLLGYQIADADRTSTGGSFQFTEDPAGLFIGTVN